MFVIEGQLVRFRTDQEPVSVNERIEDTRGAFVLRSGVVSFLVEVDSELLRGSGRSLAEPVGVFLGLRPGRRLEFHVDGSPLVLSWPKTSPQGPSLGSLRFLAQEAEAESGDILRIELGGALMTGTALRIRPTDLENEEPAAVFGMLTGARGDLDAAAKSLASALNVSPAELRALLTWRGDRRVADLMPVAPASNSLRDAAAKLAVGLTPDES